MMPLKAFILFVSFLPAAFAFEPGTCRAIPESKVYLSDHFSLPYPKEVTFTCLYECLGTDQALSDEVLGKTTVRVRNQQDDALKVVCQGVKVKQTSWGYDFDRVIPFYAYKTRMSNVRQWASQNVSKHNPFEREALKELKQKLVEVAEGYHQASLSSAPTASSFGKASELLTFLSVGLPQNAEELDRTLKSIRSGGPLLVEDDFAHQLVSGVLKSLAYWR